VLFEHGRAFTWVPAKVRRLDPNTTYQLIVGGVHVADITTSGGGNGKVRFRSRPRNDRDLRSASIRRTRTSSCGTRRASTC
jgi:hypothetical protein